MNGDDNKPNDSFPLELFTFSVPLCRTMIVKDPKEKWTNVDLKTMIQMLRASNELGLKGRKLESLAIDEKPKGRGVTFTLKWE